MFGSIRSKIQAMVITVLVLVTGLIVSFSWMSVTEDLNRIRLRGGDNILRLALLDVQTEYDQIEEYRSLVVNMRKQELRNMVGAVFTGINGYERLHRQGVLTLEEAKKKALNYVDSVRFGQDDYFFVYSNKMVCMSHPDKSMIGRDIMGLKDPRGQDIGKNLLKQAMSDPGGGFFETLWYKIGEKKHLPKILFARQYPKWGWIVGTGIYIDDIDRVVENEKRLAVNSLTKAFNSLSLGKTGKLFIFNSEKKIVVPPRDCGSSFASIKNVDTGNTVLHDLKQAAKDSKPYYEYRVLGVDNDFHDKIAQVRIFPALGWYVVSSVDAREIEKPVIDLIVKQLSIAGIILILAILFLWHSLGRICRPLAHLAHMASDIASGDIKRARERFSAFSEFDLNHGQGNGRDRHFRDEAYELLSSFMTMTDNLNSLVGKVQRAGSTVTDQAVRISSSVKVVEDAIEAQAASTLEVSASSMEISGTSEELADTMNSVSEVASMTSSLAQENVSGLQSMGQAMDRLGEAAENVSSKLSTINEKAGAISKVVVTIAKVSEQTNLLSFNASIEAEKAGEHGQGFSVVAREIRRLADQVAIAALDIEKMVSQMQGAVSSGVMEMDKFGREVEQSSNDVREVLDGMKGIIDQVRGLEPSVTAVNEGMQAQSLSAGEINTAMSDLSITVEKTKQAMSDFAHTADNLSEAVRELEVEAARFRVRSDGV